MMTVRVPICALYVALLSGCGTLLPDINEPQLAYDLWRDPGRVTEWTLSQSDADGVYEGISTLRYLAGRWGHAKAPAAARGYLKIYDRLDRAWPTLTDVERAQIRWSMRRTLERAADDDPSEAFREASRQIGPAGERPASRPAQVTPSPDDVRTGTPKGSGHAEVRD